MMKRILCMLLCLCMLVPCAAAEEDGSVLVKLLRNQFIVGGNGMRGTVNITASGAADWVNYLLPFTAAELQLRAIGKPQGGKSNMVSDDEDWQLKLYVKNGDEQLGTTQLYGNSDAMYLRSDLLPDTLLTMPVENLHLIYQLARGEMMDMFMAFDPMKLKEREEGNAPSYTVLAELLQVEENEWKTSWAPVLDKYFVELDMWLTGYMSVPQATGAKGSMTMHTVYTIPAQDVKEQAKYIMAMIVHDYDLQNLLTPHMTDEQRLLYLNSSLVYFYNACIDALPLEGNVVLERDMTAKGETVAMSVSLPMPPLPEKVSSWVGKTMADLFSLPYDNVLEGVNRITFSQEDGDLTISAAGSLRTINVTVAEPASNAEGVSWDGLVQITPAADNSEPPVSAALSYKSRHKVWEDEEWIKHEDYAWQLAVGPDLSQLAEDDPFRSSYLDFAPVQLNLDISMSNDTQRAAAPVRAEINLTLSLPGGDLGVKANLRTSSKWAMDLLPVTGGENVLTMTDERREELLTLMSAGMIKTLAALSAPAPAATDTPAAPAATAELQMEPVVTPVPEGPVPTAVPPMNAE